MTGTVASQAAYVALTNAGATVTEQTAYVVLTPTHGPAVASQAAYVVLVSNGSTPGLPTTTLRLSAGQLALLTVYQPKGNAERERVDQLAALVPYGVELMTTPRVSQMAALVVWGLGTQGTARSRAWTFVLDGHTFYVLDLGQEGTFLYDMTTREWCEFTTDGQYSWNMHNGTMWGKGRIVGGDADNGSVWELKPSTTIDQGYKDLTHLVTGVLLSRNLTAQSVENFSLAASVGQISTMTGGSVTLRYSDDGGLTWATAETIPLVEGVYSDLSWRSLGSYSSPGRIFEITDVGGMLRIEGADAAIDDFDEDKAG